MLSYNLPRRDLILDCTLKIKDTLRAIITIANSPGHNIDRVSISPSYCYDYSPDSIL